MLRASSRGSISARSTTDSHARLGEKKRLSCEVVAPTRRIERVNEHFSVRPADVVTARARYCVSPVCSCTRQCEDRLAEIESVIHTDGIRIGHLHSFRHEHWAKIRELDTRVSTLEGNPPSDWNYGNRWVRVGTGPKPRKRWLRKAAEGIARTLSFAGVGSGRPRSVEERVANFEAAQEAVKAVRHNRLHDADATDTAKADAVWDEMFGTD